MGPSYIAAQLTAMAEKRPEQLAVVVQQADGTFREYNYQALNRASNQMAAVLTGLGVGRDTRTVVMERPGFEFFALVFALFRLGAVLVAVDPGLGLKGLKQCLGEAEPEAFIGNLRAHTARMVFGWARDSLKIRIVTGACPLPLPGVIQLDKLTRQPQVQSATTCLRGVSGKDTAAILFTSGSTGIPKGVIYSHDNFEAQIGALRDHYGIQPGEIDLATFPLFALYAPAMGMTSIIPDMDFTRPGRADPSVLTSAITRYGATTMFGSPALIDRLGRWGIEHGLQLSTLKRALSAGAPVAPVVLQRFSRLLASGIDIYTPYGATESLPVCSIGSREILEETRAATDRGAGICVGKPVAGTDIFIIPISNEPVEHWDPDMPLPPGAKGEIVVSGPQVTSAYYNRPDETRLAKIHDSDGRLYHRMGDSGYLDDQGRLWFCGRKVHSVVYDGSRYFSICCEAVFNVHVAVWRSALIGLQREGQLIPALCVELEAKYHDADKRQLRQELLALGEQHEHTRVIRDIFFHPAFPVDIRHNAKINREKLATWAEGQRS